MIGDKYKLNHSVVTMQDYMFFSLYQYDEYTKTCHWITSPLTAMQLMFLSDKCQGSLTCHQLKKTAFSKLYSMRHGCFSVYWTILCKLDRKLNNHFVFWTWTFIFVINLKLISIVREARQRLPVRCVKDVTLTIREGTGLFSRSGNRTLVRKNAPR